MRLPCSIVVVGLVASLAACGESTVRAARPFDPLQLATALARIDTLLQSDLFAGFATTGPLLSVPGTSGTPPVLPDSVRGRTYVWNATTHGYEVGAQDAAKPNRVTYLLYTPDPLTGRPLEPVDSVGHLDLHDSSTTTALLHVEAIGGSDVTTVRYMISGMFAADSFVEPTRGCLTDGTGRGVCWDGQLRGHATPGDTTLVMAWTGGGGGLYVQVTGGGRRQGASLATAIDLLVADTIEDIHMVGLLTETDNAAGPPTLSADLTISVGDLPFASVTGNSTLQVREVNGRALTAGELALIQELIGTPTRWVRAMQVIAWPGRRVLGG